LKGKLENIDEVFHQAFDGFEADVDPNVWSNVQQSIQSNIGAPNSTVNAISSSAAKATAFKIAAGIIALGSLVTASYLLMKDDVVEKNEVVEQSINPEQITQENNELAVEKVSPKLVVQSINEVEIESNSEDKIIQQEKETQQNVVAENVIPDVDPQESENRTPVKDNTNSTQNNNAPTNPIVKAVVPEPVDEPVTPSLKEERFDVEILATVTEGFAPLEVEFNLEGNVVSTSWDFNDGESSHQKNAFHTFNKPGKYLVTVDVLDKNNRDKKITQTIIVKSNSPSSLAPIQNVMTPNGDNQNDVFMIKGENLLRIEVFILDRNGGMINSIRSLDAVWDGKDQNGKLVVPGIYYVSGMAIGVDGEKHKIQSAINVLK